MTNATSPIVHHATENPDSIAVREGDRHFTYRELHEHLSGAAEEYRRRGIERGDKIMLVLPTSAEFVFAYHGALSQGIVAVTVNPLCTPRELTYFAQDAGCRLVVSWEPIGGPARQVASELGLDVWELNDGAITAAKTLIPVDVPDEEDAAILYTSGTTGRPKGAVLTHGNFLACGRGYAQALRFSPNERTGTALPLFHVFGQGSVMGPTFTMGGSLSLLRAFDAIKLLEMAVRDDLTSMAGVPTMWNALLHADTEITQEQLPHLDKVFSGGAALPLEVAKAFQQRFGAVVLDGYGLSETTGAATYNDPDAERKEQSVGRAVPGGEVGIMDLDHQLLPPGEVGEVVVKAPFVMKGYWQRPEATAESRVGEWFLTGDMGRMDADGDLWIVDRKKDLIIRGGYNVYPREVEEQLYSHPAIVEAAVVGVPDERLGEEVAAVVVPKEGESIDAQELRAWLGERLSPYKVPRVYRIVGELPKGATGKILKRGIDRDELVSEGVRPARPEQ